MTFYAASIFFEVLLQFGELPPDVSDLQIEFLVISGKSGTCDFYKLIEGDSFFSLGNT